MRRTILVGLLALAAGCGDGTGPGLRMDLRFSLTEPNPDALSPIVASVEGTTLRVEGYFEAPCAGDPVRGGANLSGPATITIRVWSRRAGSTCPTMVDPYLYDGRIHNLEPGTYQVVVEHERAARRADGLVHNSTIIVP